MHNNRSRTVRYNKTLITAPQKRLFIQSWRPLANYAVKAGMVCLQVKLCDLHLSALEVRFARRSAIQIYVYLTLPL